MQPALSPISTGSPLQENWMVQEDLCNGILDQTISEQEMIEPASIHQTGIRKPFHRNQYPSLDKIDQLIQQATTEEEIRELKHQKRIMKNRQATYVLS
jgi:hypothetical protein